MPRGSGASPQLSPWVPGVTQGLRSTDGSRLVGVAAPPAFSLSQDFSTSGAADLLRQLTIGVGASLVHFRLFCSIPGLRPVGVTSTPLASTGDILQRLQTLAYVPWG